MAPVGNLGANVATFHGIPNTTGLTLPNLFEMPKLTNNIPQTPSQTMNSFPRFPLEMPQTSHQPTPSTSTTFLPANLLMSCNLSFLTPQQLAFCALQLQNQQLNQQTQLNQQQSPPAINNNFLNQMNVGMVTQFMPFVQQPFFGNIPLAATLPLIQTPNHLFQQQQYIQSQQVVSKAEQPPPTSTYLHSSSFFQTPTSSNISPTTPNLNLQNNIFSTSYQNLVPTNTFTLVSNPPEASNHQKEHTQHTQNIQQPPTLQQTIGHRISPPTIRTDSPEFNDLSDSNMPPMLQPELPCLMEFTDSDEFSAPPELLPDHCMFDDECGPPRLEPQVPIPTNSESDQHEDIYKTDYSTTMSPPSTDLSPTKLNNEKEHPLFDPILTEMLKNATALSSPKFNSTQPISRKRERSYSTDSSDLMFKMPKLVSMVEEADVGCSIIEEADVSYSIIEEVEKVNEIEEAMDETVTTAPIEEDRESTPPVLDENVEKVEELEEPEITEVIEKVEESEVAEIIEKVEESEVAEIIEPVESELVVSVDHHDVSVASSSGVSSMDSANSSMLAEEPIIIRFKRPMEVKIIPEEREKTPYSDFEQEYDSSPAPSPLTALQNTKLPSRQQQRSKSRKSSKSSKCRSKPLNKFPEYYFSTGKRRGGHKKPKGVEIHSNWRPVGEEEIREVRLNSENQYQKRRCFQAIRHVREKDEIIRVRDCVKVNSSEGLENIGKIIQIFLDEPSASICVQVLWYYTQAQTSQDIILNEKELLASRHCDVINSDSIEEHAYVLSYAEYCRFVAETRLDELPPSQRPLESSEIMSRGDPSYGRRLRLPHEDSPIDLVYWCGRTFSIKTKKICVSVMSSRRGSRHNHGRRPTRSNRC